MGCNPKGRKELDTTEHVGMPKNCTELSPLKHHSFSNADGETIWTLCAGWGFVIEQES